jgi:hypothetical protein
MIRKSVFYIGCNDKETMKQEITSDKIQETILTTFLEKYQGFTILPCQGVYTMESGQVVIEKSFQVIVYFSNEQDDCEICESLKKQLNQESIAIESGLVDSKLI